MKIQPNKFLGLLFDADMQTQIYSIQKKKIDIYPIIEERDKYSKELYNLLVSEGNRNYIMTKSSIDISENIKCDLDKLDGTIYKGLKVGKKISVLINDRLFFRYLVTDNSILCLWVLTEPIMYDGKEQNYMRYTIFRINTENGKINLPDSEKEETKILFKKFIQYLTFLEFSELETVTLKPNCKIGTKKNGKYLNDSNFDVTIVDSNWNKTIIVGEFGVSGHLRLQPTNNGRKLIYIKEYVKRGYLRKSKKLEFEN